jgi:hypothetical protein
MDWVRDLMAFGFGCLGVMVMLQSIIISRLKREKQNRVVVEMETILGSDNLNWDLLYEGSIPPVVRGFVARVGRSGDGDNAPVFSIDLSHLPPMGNGESFFIQYARRM